MRRNSLRVIGIAACIQLLAIGALVLTAAYSTGSTSIHLLYVGLLGGLTAGVLSSQLYSRQSTERGFWLLGDAVLNGSIAATVATTTALVCQSLAMLVTIRLQQGFWAPLIVGVYQGIVVALYLFCAVLFGGLGAVIGHWVGNFVGTPIQKPR